MIDTSKLYKVKVKLDISIHIQSGYFIDIKNIKSIESGQVISWYHHNVFNYGKKIDVYVDIDESGDGHHAFYAAENDLYNFKALQALSQKDDFKNEKYSFFFYDEVKRLLKQPHNDVKNMSGLFQKGTTL